MPEQATIERARQDAREGKSPSTQAGEFVREEFHHIREGIHGARSAKQAIAIGLSKARRAGVRLFTKKNLAGVGLEKVPPPSRGLCLTKFREKKKKSCNRHTMAPAPLSECKFRSQKCGKTGSKNLAIRC
jgi:hypothetical protein